MGSDGQLRCSVCGGQTVRAEREVAGGYECYCACGHVYVSKSIAAGVSFQRYTRKIAERTAEAEGTGAKFTKEGLRDNAADCLREAEKVLQALIDSYPDENLSACHPKAGYKSALDQVARLRKGIAKGRV
ncbi:TPA: hypothetical protein NPP60_005049 [Klebsiella variicola subsp. variicola]|nr:hypothetical protein [Klebsiella variicola subsp. variicola]